MEYDVYYSTGGLNMIGGGADVWVNKWLELIPQHLKTESKLLIHRTRPPGINQIVLWKFIGKDTIEKNLKNY